MPQAKIKSVPTNIITGFLGAGKTTIIQQLLTSKPEHERWAVLVNEFGEIGIDGAMFDKGEKNEVFIREVPGGCMCCSSGLPMQIALNQLLAKAKPHRLLIEPTGLGHPTEVLTTLSAEHYREVLQLGATLTLVDARKLTEPRWREHDTFQEQLAIADQIIATKADTYDEHHLPQLKNYLGDLGLQQTPVHIAEHGKIDARLLSKPSGFRPKVEVPHEHAHTKQNRSAEEDIPAMLSEHGMVKSANQGQGFFSCGWVVPAERVFKFESVMSILSAVDAQRLKAVFITDRGIFAFNLADGVLKYFELDECDDSRLEFLCAEKDTAETLATELESTLFEM